MWNNLKEYSLQITADKPSFLCRQLCPEVHYYTLHLVWNNLKEYNLQITADKITAAKTITPVWTAVSWSSLLHLTLSVEQSKLRNIVQTTAGKSTCTHTLYTIQCKGMENAGEASVTEILFTVEGYIYNLQLYMIIVKLHEGILLQCWIKSASANPHSEHRFLAPSSKLCWI